MVKDSKETVKDLIIVLAGIYGEFSENELSIQARPLLDELTVEGYIKRVNSKYMASDTAINIAYNALRRIIGRSATVRLVAHGLSVVKNDKCVFVITHLTNEEEDWWVKKILEEYKESVKSNAKLGNLRRRLSIEEDGPLHPEFLWDMIHSGIAVNALLSGVAEKVRIRSDDAWIPYSLEEELVGSKCDYFHHIYRNYPPVVCFGTRAWAIASVKCSSFKVMPSNMG